MVIRTSSLNLLDNAGKSKNWEKQKMKPKHLFYGVAVVAAVIAIVYAIQGSIGMALVAALVASCSLLNSARPAANRAAGRNDFRRFFGIR